MGISVILGLALGTILDRRLGTTPLFFWIGLGLGVGAAAKSIVTIAKKTKKELSENDADTPKKN